MKIRILIVDDIESMRILVSQFLRKHREVEIVGQAENAAEAIQKASELKPDIVLTDISLPDTSGVEVAKKIKEKLSGVKVYLFSAYEIDEIRELDHLHSPADGYIQKSNLKPELEAMLQKEIQSRR